MKMNPEHTHIGIGLTSARDTAASAFPSSASACNKLMEMALTGSAVRGLGQYCFAKDAYDAWTQQCEEEDHFPFQVFEVDLPPQQKLSATRSQKESQEHIIRIYEQAHLRGEYESTGGENVVALQAMQLHAWPCNWLRTLINAPQFTTWMKYYCQVPLFQSGTKCNRP